MVKIEQDTDMIQIRYRRDFQKYLLYLALALVMMFMLYVFNIFSFLNPVAPTMVTSTDVCHSWETSHLMKQKQCRYSVKYPFTPPYRVEDGIRYKIGAIADLDEERSKVSGEKFTWQSFYKTGYLTKLNSGRFVVEWKDIVTLKSKLNEKGRGLELSELCAFNGKLYTVDDRTGIVYRVHKKKVIPWVILMDGDGNSEKGFKSEWMTVKDGTLFVGGLGKEWTTKSGKFLNYFPLFVKSIDQLGAVVHHNWTDNYLKIRAKVGIYFPGYMIHEAVMWSSIRKRWYFLPRRMSKQTYDDMIDERRGTNVLISCREDFTDVRVVFVGKVEPTHGFSSFKFLPGSNDEIAVALKSKEVDGIIQSYIMVFRVDDGHVLMPEQFVANNKFEGVEFI